MIRITIVLLVLLLFSCEKLDLPGGIPNCIKRKIRQIKNYPVRNPPAKVYEQTLSNGDKLYYIPPYCCDVQSELYDSDCNIICHPDGGLSGAGDGQCPEDLLKTVVNTKLIWEDKRTD